MNIPTIPYTIDLKVADRLLSGGSCLALYTCMTLQHWLHGYVVPTVMPWKFRKHTKPKLRGVALTRSYFVGLSGSTHTACTSIHKLSLAHRHHEHILAKDTESSKLPRILPCVCELSAWLEFAVKGSVHCERPLVPPQESSTVLCHFLTEMGLHDLTTCASTSRSISTLHSQHEAFKVRKWEGK